MITAPCPYCGEPVEATFDHSNAELRELRGEQGECCHIPFSIDEQGPLGQDGERPRNGETMNTTEINPATKLPHTPAFLARIGAALRGPFKATDVKTPEGWQIVTTGYGASRIAEHAPSRDKARARAREMNA